MQSVVRAQTCRLQATPRFNCDGMPNVSRIATMRRSEVAFGGCERTPTRCQPSVHGGKFKFGCRADAYRVRQFDGGKFMSGRRCGVVRRRCVQFDGGRLTFGCRGGAMRWRRVWFDGSGSYGFKRFEGDA